MFVSLLGIYLLSTGASWGIFTLVRGEPKISDSGKDGQEKTTSRVDTSQPKTESCPLNGEMFTKSEKDIWMKRRPLLASIENHLDSRPQSGLSKADIVYEVVAEGGITRFLAGYYCRASAEDVRIGPIRSARIYLVNWVTEYGSEPLFVHVGGANNICKNCPGGIKPAGTTAREVRALEELVSLGWRSANGNALDAGANVDYPEVWRDYERIPGAATEHTYMGSTDKLFDLGIQRGFGYDNGDGDPWNKQFVPWRFVDEKALENPTASTISFIFWKNKPDYDVTWKYDKASNSYYRFHGENKHIDMDTNTQLSAKNIVIQFVKETGPVDKEFHMVYQTIGKGDFTAFQNGDKVTGTWEKTSQKSRTRFYTNDKKELGLVKGVTWIEVVPKGNEVEYN